MLKETLIKELKKPGRVAVDVQIVKGGDPQLVFVEKKDLIHIYQETVADGDETGMEVDLNNGIRYLMVDHLRETEGR